MRKVKFNRMQSQVVSHRKINGILPNVFVVALITGQIERKSQEENTKRFNGEIVLTILLQGRESLRDIYLKTLKLFQS